MQNLDPVRGLPPPLSLPAPLQKVLQFDMVPSITCDRKGHNLARSREIHLYSSRPREIGEIEIDLHIVMPRQNPSPMVLNRPNLSFVELAAIAYHQNT